MSKVKIKTNAMRILDSNKVNYSVHSYDAGKDHVDGVEVASIIKRDVKEVFKTLVSIGASKNYYVYVIPVNENLDLKKAAKVANEKNIEMINVKDINKITGYIRGGCSPIGMKKLYNTFIHDSAKELDTIIVSAGKIGYQVEVGPTDLKKIIKFEYEDIIKD
ncbi:MAG: Cys-tRNA(Pro) deacylase [Peptostreptococcaceae bacterium]